ncbi:MAG: hypothetical protein LAN83_09815 [Acidobacteriia bacterium]|nr:hypothetical protein [Terriglobia bacterium]
MKPLQACINRQQNRGIFQNFGMLVVVLLAWCTFASAQHWTPVTPYPGSGAGTAILRTDGIVMVQELTAPASAGGHATGNWWELVPDSGGSYATGSWSLFTSTASLGYAPLYFGSAVLPNDQIVFVGGEYNFGVQDDTNMGFVYRPILDKWISLSPPSGWSKIGDAPTVVLPNGTFMVGDCCSAKEALLDFSTLTWTSTGTGKADNNSEEGWTLLPNGKVLTVDTQNGTESELYNPSTGKWSLAGKLPNPLPYNCGLSIVPELGPAVLRPNGTVFVAGANGFTDIYKTSTKKWSKGPIFPPNSAGEGQDGVADGPAAILPDGNVLVMASNINPCFITPSDFYEFNGSTFITAPSPPNASNEVSYDGRMLVLPNGGHILFTDGTQDVEVYIPAGSAKSAWKPTITSFPSSVTRGNSYTIKGTQFNGLTQGAAYGDDAQSATNFPLVRLTDAVGNVYYAVTKNFSTMGVATGSKVVSATFIPPTSMPVGPATMVVVANGIESDSVGLTVF